MYIKKTTTTTTEFLWFFNCVGRPWQPGHAGKQPVSSFGTNKHTKPWMEAMNWVLYSVSVSQPYPNKSLLLKTSLSTWESPLALRPASQKYSPCCFQNRSDVSKCLWEPGSISPGQGKLSAAAVFYTYLPQVVINGVIADIDVVAWSPVSVYRQISLGLAPSKILIDFLSSHFCLQWMFSADWQLLWGINKLS